MSQRVEIVANLQVKKGDLKVRHRGSQSSIFVRTLRSFTNGANAAGNCPETLTVLALKHEHLPPILTSTTIDYRRRLSRGGLLPSIVGNLGGESTLPSLILV